MLQAAVLALGVLTNNDKIDILVACLNTGDGFAHNDVGKEVQLQPGG